MMDFVAWPKLPRLHKDIVVTEKIDGTNAAIIVESIPNPRPDLDVEPRTRISLYGGEKYEPAQLAGADGSLILVGAQSRKRLITPEQDNFGFAKWVFDNAAELVEVLGVGRHYGEWWGSGIQRGYGLPKGSKRFSLFNVSRYTPIIEGRAQSTSDSTPLIDTLQLGVVPTLYQGPFSEQAIEDAMQTLDELGSRASVGFKPAEGVVIFHEAAQQLFKWPFDPEPKGTPYTPPEPLNLKVTGSDVPADRTLAKEGLTRSNGVWTN